jgi:hypothetical protein
LPHRQRPKRPLLQRDPQILQQPRNPKALLDIDDREAINARGVRASIAVARR